MSTISDQPYIYIRSTRERVPVSKQEFDDYYRDINAYRRRQQEHGRCVCPRNKRLECDMDCYTCPFRRAGDLLSLDYTVENGEGCEKSWLDDLQDECADIQAIVEDRDLLNALYRHLSDLDSDGQRICELLLADKTEREIADIMGFPAQSSVNYRKQKAFSQLRALLSKYI